MVQGYFSKLVIMSIMAVVCSEPSFAARNSKKTKATQDPAPVSVEWEALPSSYMPTPPKQLAQWVSEKSSPSESLDNFSTSTEVFAAEQATREYFSSKGAIGVEIPASVSDSKYGAACTLKYQPDTETLQYSTPWQIYAEFKHVKRPTDRHLKILSYRASKDRASRVGQNAFGATVEVTSIQNLDISIATPLANVKSGRPPNSLRIPPSEARHLVKNLSCLLVFTIEPPFYYEGYDTIPPTMSNPVQISTQDIVIFGKVIGLWLFDSKTRQVLAKDNFTP